MRKLSTRLPVLALAASCAMQTGAPAGSDPEVVIAQISNVASAARNDQGPISVRFGVQVHNVARDPITVVRVVLQSVGYGAYELPSYSQPFNATIAPGQTGTIALWAPASANATVVGANGPVTIRGSVEFAMNGNRYQKTVVETVNSNGGVDR